MKRNLLKAIGLGAISGCAATEPTGRSVNTVVINYTDRYIAEVAVNGTWAGAADAYSGEGNRVQGLLAPSDPNRQVVLKVKWIVSGRLDFSTNRYVELPVEEKSASVEVARPFPANPSYLILHFYPDGHVEAELEADRPKRRIPPPPGYPR
jgi:Protein of unknown function (DUF3304)